MSDFTPRGKKISTTSMGSSTSEGDSFNIKEMSEAPLGIADCQYVSYWLVILCFVDDNAFEMTLKPIDESVDEENDMGVVKKDTLLEEGHNNEVGEKESQEQLEIEKEPTYKGLHDESETNQDMDDKEKHAPKKSISLPCPKK